MTARLKNKKNISAYDVFEALSDNLSTKLFEAMKGESKCIVKAEDLDMSRKQYYSRLSRMKRTGLITQSRPYRKTTFGKVTQHASELIQKAVKNSVRLRAIDAVVENTNEDERYEIAEQLLDDPELRQIVLSL